MCQRFVIKPIEYSDLDSPFYFPTFLRVIFYPYYGDQYIGKLSYKILIFFTFGCMERLFCIYKPRAIIICTNPELAFRILLMTFMPSAYNSFNVQVFIEINVNRINCLMDSQCIYHAKNQNDSACSNMRFFEKK
jgi:hypothetical protein